MACGQNPHPFGEQGRGSVAPVPGAATAASGPWLVVSNAPETLDVSLPPAGALYKCEIPLAANIPKAIRVFVWHLNKTGGTRTVSLRLCLDGNGTGTQSAFQYSSAVVNSLSFGSHGRQLACIQLFGTFDSSSADCQLDQTESVPWSASVPNNLLVGALIQFNVVALADCNLRLRTVFQQSGAPLPPWAQDPVTPGPHIRGRWPYSAITLPLSATFDLNGAVSPAFIECPIDEVRNLLNQQIIPPELDVQNAFGKQQSDQFGSPTPGMGGKPTSGNRGLYGVDLRYHFQLINTDMAASHSCYIRLLPRDNGTGNKTFGAGNSKPRLDTLAGLYPQSNIVPVPQRILLLEAQHLR